MQIIKVGLAVPAKFSAFTTELRIAEVLQRQLSSRAVKYSHFELKNVVIVKNKYSNRATLARDNFLFFWSACLQAGRMTQPWCLGYPSTRDSLAESPGYTLAPGIP